MTKEEVEYLKNKWGSILNQESTSTKLAMQIEPMELKEDLEAFRKQNFEKVSNYCVKKYKETYGSSPDDNNFRFLVSDYYGTGEGRTICVLLTQALASATEDFCYEGEYKELTTKDYRAVREFHKYFGTWMLHGLEFVSKEDFFGKYGHLLPPALVELKDKDCFLNYYSELHFNFA